MMDPPNKDPGTAPTRKRNNSREKSTNSPGDGVWSRTPALGPASLRNLQKRIFASLYATSPTLRGWNPALGNNKLRAAKGPPLVSPT